MALQNLYNDSVSSNDSMQEYNIGLDNLFQLETNSALIMAGIVRDDVKFLSDVVIRIWLNSILGYVGIIANSIAILAFVKLGFRETINITLTNIAIWDLLKCIFCVVKWLYAIIRWFSIVAAISAEVIGNQLVFYLFSYCNHVSCMLAGYLAIERCLCVSRPFHVKFLVSPKNIAIMNLVTSLAVLFSLVVCYTRYEIVWVHDAKFNATVASVAVRMFRNREIVSQYYDIISVLYPLVAFVIICVCTGIIYYYLRKSAEFRAQTTISQPEMTSKEDDCKANRFQLSPRDRRIIKLLFIILIVYIINIFPRLIRYGFKMFVPDFHSRGRFRNLYEIASYLMILFDLMNAVINPFIYFFMSSEFKSTVRGMFCKAPKI